MKARDRHAPFHHRAIHGVLHFQSLSVKSIQLNTIELDLVLSFVFIVFLIILRHGGPTWQIFAILNFLALTNEKKIYKNLIICISKTLSRTICNHFVYQDFFSKIIYRGNPWCECINNSFKNIINYVDFFCSFTFISCVIVEDEERAM